MTPLRAVVLDTVTVNGQVVPRYLEEFYVRRAQGFGSFLAPADIERWWPNKPSGLVPRLSGLKLIYNGDGTVLISSSRAPSAAMRGYCPPLIFLDGAFVGNASTFDVDAFLWVENLAAIEAYSSVSNMPVQFNLKLGNHGAECGALVIWTKQ